MSLMLPQGQKLLTNVSVVRIKKGKEKVRHVLHASISAFPKHRPTERVCVLHGVVRVWVCGSARRGRARGGQFEIATYPNTVVTWRTGAEKDVREVLQIDRVFRSVEQGEYAKSKDLQKCFGSDDQAAICLEILKAGEIQLTEKERGSQQESLLKEICTMVAERCVNSQSKRPVTVGVVERALAELHFNVDRNKNAKKQALEAIKLLEGKYPIERLPMNLKITFPQAAKAEARAKMAALGAIFDREDDRCAAHRKETARNCIHFTNRIERHSSMPLLSSIHISR